VPSDAGAYRQQVFLSIAINGDLIRNNRAGTNQTHGPDENVDELGQLVQAALAKEPSDGSYSRVFVRRKLIVVGHIGFVQLRILAKALFGIGMHGPELKDAEQAAAESEPPLTEKDRPRGRCVN
jgi:hypothetical protein